MSDNMDMPRIQTPEDAEAFESYAAEIEGRAPPTETPERDSPFTSTRDVIGSIRTRRVACEGGCGREVVQTKLPHPDRELWMPKLCVECVESAESTRTTAQRERAKIESDTRVAEQLKARLANLRVPRQYAGAQLSNFDTRGISLLEHKLAKAREFVARWPEEHSTDHLTDFPAFVILQGEPGTGKSHVLWAIARQLVIQHNASARVVSLADIIREIRATWGGGAGRTEEHVLNEYRNVDFLGIDECSRHALYGQPTQHLYDLIGPREASLRPTMIVTNEKIGTEDGSGFEEFIGPALVSRASAWGGVWQFGDDDYRVARSEQRARRRRG